MKIVIVEDEQHNYRLLKGMIKELRPKWEIIELLESVKGAVKWFQENPQPDLIFMDIQLTDGISFSIFNSIEIKSMIIFTTAYDEYAIQAFNVNAIDYILKPIKKEKLEKAILKFEELYSAPNKQVDNLPDYKQLLSILSTNTRTYRTRFLVSGTTASYKVETSDIAYFSIVDRFTNAVLFNGKEHIIDSTMEKLEEQLDPKQFFRANRSFILNIDAIDRFEHYFGGKLIVKLNPPFKESITISRLKASAFKNWLDDAELQ